MPTSPRSRRRRVCYLAETDAAARDGAAALERVPAGPDRTVQPFTTDETERLRSWAPEVDCVVFAETPTTAAGASLLEAVDACGETPLILYTDSTYAPAAARSTDGVDGYVRRDADDAMIHLADEIEWSCRNVDAVSYATRRALPNAAADADEPNPTSEPLASEEPIAVGPARSAADEAVEPAEPDARDGTRESDKRERNQRERTRLEAQRERLAAELDDRTAECDRLEANLAALEADRERLRTAFASLPEPALRYDLRDGEPIVRAVSDAFVEAFGGDRDSIVGEPIGGDGSVVAPGLEGRAPTLVDTVCSSERRRFDTRRETADGVREFRCTVAPCAPRSLESNGTDDAPEGRDRTEGLVVYADVTDAARRKRDLAAADARLEAIVELLEDARTPLNVARGYLEIAAETGDPAHFAEIDDAQETLRKRLDRLDAVARGDDSAVDADPIALHAVARRAWAGLDTGDARLVTATELVLEADETRLRELLEHLFRATLSADDSRDGDDTEERESQGKGESPVVTVGATDDGFSVTRPRTGTRRGIERDLAAAERVADAHGWSVEPIGDENEGEDGNGDEDGRRVGVACRGIERADIERPARPEPRASR